ncbi:elongation factor 4 [Candidatus Microgenomates bacterium]|nr:elongation factor 4 [Candidatus Microgenomates bacterium]
MSQIRNFAIIAHIDHGKSTLADRLLEMTGTISKGGHDEQLLDRNPISRERGITIKLAPVRMTYNGYMLNLIDTPGHVDFSYEVDRTLACVEGAILLVDATQGIQAQTIANAYKALEKNLVIIPVVNKIDMPNAQVAETKKDLADFLGCSEDDIFAVSAKTGENVQALLDSIVTKIPPPEIKIEEPLRALIFDSYFDSHKGVIAFVRVFGGSAHKIERMRLAAANVFFETTEVGIFTPDLVSEPVIHAGEIGYIVTNLKDIHEVRVGDTIILEKSPDIPVSGYRRVKSMVYASMFPTDTHDYLNLKKALEKLYLNDSSLEFNAIHSKALGAGFRVGFLGLLHADVVRERLEREYDLDLVLTPPQVEYDYDGHVYKEPIVKIMLVFPQEYTGPVMQLCENYRGTFIAMDNKHQTSVTYEMPMSEMISDFFDRLKSVSSGYASLDWELVRFQDVKADKLNVLLNLDPIEEFSEVVVIERAQEKATALVKKLREVIPRQQYEVKIQAQYKGKIIASERIAAFRKDVLIKNSKVVGAGDVGRKKKLLEKQKEGKKKMKMVGKVEIPKEAFMKMFNKSS